MTREGVYIAPVRRTRAVHAFEQMHALREPLPTASDYVAIDAPCRRGRNAAGPKPFASPSEPRGILPHDAPRNRELTPRVTPSLRGGRELQPRRGQRRCDRALARELQLGRSPRLCLPDQ